MSQNNNQADLAISKDDLKNILIDNDAQLLVRKAERAGKKLGRQLTTNQIRAIFGTVRQIEKSWRGDAEQEAALFKLILLKPKMKYRAAKEGRRGSGLNALADVLGQAIDIVSNDNGNKRKKFSNFVQFFEAILAYHKVAGGR